MSQRPVPLRTALTLGAAALVLAGCTVAPSTPTTTATTTSDTPSATVTTPTPTAPLLTVTPSPTASGLPTLGTVVTPGAPTTTASTDAGVAPGTATTPSLISAGPGTLVVLGLGNAFHADGWASGSYQPAGATARSLALAATVNCAVAGPEIEYRVLPTNSSIKVTVAQELMSDSSDNTVTFSLVTDGKVVNEKPVTFKQTAELVAPLTGVTVVKITAVAKAPCKTSSTALITRAIIQG
ncbi:MAG TPA: hypothetical protein PKL63_00670 [Dermatophilaceae bacterium]|mgnify:CR=1 FL=1|nr:hypothetical protein [Dermatophilaceae bacterium]